MSTHQMPNESKMHNCTVQCVHNRTIEVIVCTFSIPNHHPSKMDVLPKTFVQIILAAKCLVRHSSTSPNQQRQPLPSLLYSIYPSSRSLRTANYLSSTVRLKLRPNIPCLSSLVGDKQRPIRGHSCRGRMRHNPLSSCKTTNSPS